MLLTYQIYYGVFIFSNLFDVVDDSLGMNSIVLQILWNSS
jgi:hypothetical protein